MEAALLEVDAGAVDMSGVKTNHADVFVEVLRDRRRFT